MLAYLPVDSSLKEGEAPQQAAAPHRYMSLLYTSSKHEPHTHAHTDPLIAASSTSNEAGTTGMVH